MRIANADKLKDHFEHVVMVKLFTVPEILTIIDTFSSEVDDNEVIALDELEELKFPVYDSAGNMIGYGILMKDVRQMIAKHHFGGTEP